MWFHSVPYHYNRLVIINHFIEADLPKSSNSCFHQAFMSTKVSKKNHSNDVDRRATYSTAQSVHPDLPRLIGNYHAQRTDRQNGSAERGVVAGRYISNG